MKGLVIGEFQFEHTFHHEFGDEIDRSPFKLPCLMSKKHYKGSPYGSEILAGNILVSYQTLSVSHLGRNLPRSQCLPHEKEIRITPVPCDLAVCGPSHIPKTVDGAWETHLHGLLYKLFRYPFRLTIPCMDLVVRWGRVFIESTGLILREDPIRRDVMKRLHFS